MIVIFASQLRRYLPSFFFVNLLFFSLQLIICGGFIDNYCLNQLLLWCCKMVIFSFLLQKKLFYFPIMYVLIYYHFGLMVFILFHRMQYCTIIILGNGCVKQLNGKEPFHHVYVYQNIIIYTLRILQFICQSYFNKIKMHTQSMKFDF